MAAILAVALPQGALAQTAAQRAALARLGSALPQVAPPNGVEATTVPLNQPTGLAFDSTGNIYIADTNDEVIREVSVTGVISTVAGSGTEGFGGDSGPATSALLDTPTGVAVDANDNIYIADTLNNRIREVSGGMITTIAGTGAPGLSGDGGAAKSAELDQPTAVAVDSKGNIYIADTDNNCIREISGTTISTVAGNGLQSYFGDGGLATAAALNLPTGVAVDAAFNIYIGDTGNQRVRMVASATKNITTIAGTGVGGFNGDGPALSTELAGPSGLYVDAAGTVYVADSDNNRIRTIVGGNVATFAGSGAQGYTGDGGTAASALLNTPEAVIAVGGSVLFSDTLNNRVREVTADIMNTNAGAPSGSAESLILGSAVSAVYGTGTLTATFSNGGQTATGMVTFYDGDGASPATIGQAPLTGNAATVSTSALSANTHYIFASYPGDAKNAPIISGLYVYSVTPAPLTATANTATMLFGQAVPALTGTLTSVLAQDAGKVTAVFSTTATSTSNPGFYPINVALTGSAAGNYTVSLGAGSGSLTISQAPTTTALGVSTGSGAPALSLNVTPGQSVKLSATVASTTTGTPTGTVNFYDNGTLLNTTPVSLSAGVATYTLTTLTPGGTHTLTATYSGSTDYKGSSNTSTATVTVAPLDFTVNLSGLTSQTVIPGQSVSYTFKVTPDYGSYPGTVTFTATGLPTGAAATFSPPSIAANGGPQTVTVTIQTAVSTVMEHAPPPPGSSGRGAAPLALAGLLLLGLGGMRKYGRGLRRMLCVLVLLGAGAAAALSLGGCGGGTGGFFGQSPQNYTITITVTAGGLNHSGNVTLNVQ